MRDQSAYAMGEGRNDRYFLYKDCGEQNPTFRVQSGSHPNFDPHLRIAKHRHAEASPYRLVVRHSSPELARHLCGGRQDSPVGLGRVIRVDVGDVPPIEPNCALSMDATLSKA
jgi:hypothetical protein